MSKRAPYRPEQALALKRIDDRRRRIGITEVDLVSAAGISLSTYRRMIADGRGFPSAVRALRFALRTIEAKRKAAEVMFDG